MITSSCSARRPERRASVHTWRRGARRSSCSSDGASAQRSPASRKTVSRLDRNRRFALPEEASPVNASRGNSFSDFDSILASLSWVATRWRGLGSPRARDDEPTSFIQTPRARYWQERKSHISAITEQLQIETYYICTLDHISFE